MTEHRPAHPLLAPAPKPKGLRRDVAPLIEKVAGGTTARDLVFLAPTGAIDRRQRVMIADAPEEEIVTIEAEVDAHVPPATARMPYRVRLRDETGFLSVAYFRPQPEMLKRLWPLGQRRLVSGKVERWNGERQMLHPDHVADPQAGDLPNVEPVYPLTAGLPLRTLQRAVKASLALLEAPPEWLSASTVQAHGWPDFAAALRRLHAPEDPDDIAPQGPFRTRLAFDELFARQCSLHLRRATRRSQEGTPIAADGRLAARILAALPFQPTRAQTRAFGEIAADMGRPYPMLRLLQGDVGSGKTLVAAMAMAQAAEAGMQSALMAPTEILARQHAQSVTPLLESAGLTVATLTGRDKAAVKRVLRERLINGDLDAVIGTHALFQEDVAFARLGLVIIDEQHRFGVSDRVRLVEKGHEPHVLVMSATPIPRTLALAVHGDTDLSVLDEKPPGRKPIRTVTIPMTRMDEVVEALAAATGRGERGYWVCPLVSESEQVDLAAVEERFAALQGRFGDRVALVHGRMGGSAREAAMERFRTGEAAVLVATTVIEVGVNVPEATIMVIEHAERFGLAQLHQLRGRVGRGDQAGSCVLLWRPPLGETAKLRLDSLRRTEDGFEIAEIDYRLRGAGDMLGVRQSGLPPFRFVAPEAHAELLAAADQEARLAIERDPSLASERGAAVRLALALFGLDAVAQTARSG